MRWYTLILIRPMNHVIKQYNLNLMKDNPENYILFDGKAKLEDVKNAASEIMPFCDKVQIFMGYQAGGLVWESRK